MAKLTILLALVVAAAVVHAETLDRKKLDERLRLLKDDNNKIEHGTNADRKENNGILGHWGGEQEWKKQGPKKQRKAKYGRRTHSSRNNKPKKVSNDFDDARLQDLDFTPATAANTEINASNAGPVDVRRFEEQPRRSKQQKIKSKDKKQRKHHLRKSEKAAMKRALEKGVATEKVLESFAGKKGERKFPKKFYKKFLNKYEMKKNKKYRKAAKKAAKAKVDAAAAVKIQTP
jgi:hypothetical protein